MYDPNSAEDKSFKSCTAGQKIMIGVGFERSVSQNGNPMISVGMLVLKDMEGNNEEGSIVIERFTLTEKAIFRLGLFCQAVGWNEPFDPASDQAIKKITSRRPTVCTVSMSEYNGKSRPNIDRHAKYTGGKDSSWEHLITEGRKECAQIWKRMNDKKNNGGGGGGYSGSGGGYSGSGGGGNDYDQDDDIPF